MTPRQRWKHAYRFARLEVKREESEKKADKNQAMADKLYGSPLVVMSSGRNKKAADIWMVQFGPPPVRTEWKFVGEKLPGETLEQAVERLEREKEKGEPFGPAFMLLGKV